MFLSCQSASITKHARTFRPAFASEHSDNHSSSDALCVAEISPKVPRADSKDSATQFDRNVGLLCRFGCAHAHL